MTHGIVEILANNATVQSVVGQNSDGDTTKVYPVIVPQQESPPYVCVRVTGITPFVCKGEQTTQETDRIQVDCYAESYREAYLIYRTVRSVLDNLITTLDDGTEIYISIADAQDLSVQQMIELGFIAQKGLYGIMSFFNAEVKLAELT